MPYSELFQELGMTAAESSAYLALLELGTSSAGPIIKKTGLHRATAYQVLQRLQEKGLVSSVIAGNRQLFEPASPKRLLDVLRERQARLEDALPKLNNMFSGGKDLQRVEVYTGVNGIRTVMDSMLDEVGRNGKYCDFGVSGFFKKAVGAYWYSFQRKKRERNIHSRVIFNEDVKRKDPELLAKYFGEARFHPSNFQSITDTFIYKDTVILAIWTAKQPVAVVIKNTENAKSYENQFRLMWQHAMKR
jgi:sugar-specific transcriptional regulator TrmB